MDDNIKNSIEIRKNAITNTYDIKERKTNETITPYMLCSM